MKNVKIDKIGAVVLTAVLIASMLVLPMSGAVNISTNETSMVQKIINKNLVNNPGYGITEFPEDDRPDEPIQLDTIYVPEEEILLAGEQNDIGYNVDAGNSIQRSTPLYVGEPADQSVPGRGRTGSLDPSGDTKDWYKFSVCEGQSIQASLSSSDNYDLELCDTAGTPVGQSYTADATGLYFIYIFANDGAGSSDYTFTVTLSGQNDAGTGGDAGNDISAATSISPGSYIGYMDVNDQEDWYSFSVSSGQGIFVTVEPMEKSDYDIHLYNPSGELVHSAQYYGDDELEFPADVSGTWKIKLDMFPGWDTSKWPDNYFLYGSGVYELELTVGGSAQSPPGPIPQPDITPVAQTFIINDDPNSNKDEYGYLAAVPAANYIDSGKRYVSPITTQYLLDDWNTYLDRHGMTTADYVVPSDPIQAAASIATDKWTSSDTAVIAVDGSSFTDEIKTVANTDVSLSSPPTITKVSADSSKFKKIGGVQGIPMFLGKEWGAIHLLGSGDDFGGDTGVMTPRYYGIGEDWWPYPYDFKGPDMDTFFPVVIPGLWVPYVTSQSGLDELEIIKYPGDRYTIPVTNTDCSINVTISTNDASNLVVYLVDPQGDVRAPQMKHYNGGEINPIHIWNGGHWMKDYDEFRTLIIKPHTEYSVEIHYPMKGEWTAIVVPFLDHELGDIGFNGNYHINAKIREHNPSRINAALSAANAAVIASAEHAPLLYVTEDSVPSETSDALSQLGVTNIIFVNINDVSSASPGGSVTEYTSMQDVIDAIKGHANSDNFITITSLGSGDGYFAPAAMMAAYHGSPVLNIGETPDAYNALGQAASWREYAGDYYHGCLSLGHLPHMHEPSDLENPTSWLEVIIYYLTHGKEFPPLGLDLKLTLYSTIHGGIYNMIADYGLDRDGKEAYLFVADRDNDIRDVVCRAMTGNISFAGHIPVPTAAWASDIIVRDILYPAVIYSNPGRDVTTSQMMNFPDGWTWTTNDGERSIVFSTQELKNSFSSHGRFFEGHCIWDGLLKRYNTGASVSYYSGHGTGGSGISCQFYNVNQEFPYCELTHENLKDKNWWDAWRGYHYDDQLTKTPRHGGFTWYNAKEPNLYDLIHFKWADQAFKNLHSLFDFWMSCTTASHLGPMVTLAHGAALYYGNGGTGLCPESDLLDDSWMHDVMVNGESVGYAFSNYVWLHQRDYTTLDPTTLYGISSEQVTNAQMIFGDPTMTVFSPEWTEPTPVSP
jgi:hypothetical protein